MSSNFFEKGPATAVAYGLSQIFPLCLDLSSSPSPQANQFQ